MGSNLETRVSHLAYADDNTKLNMYCDQEFKSNDLFSTNDHASNHQEENDDQKQYNRVDSNRSFQNSDGALNSPRQQKESQLLRIETVSREYSDEPVFRISVNQPMGQMPHALHSKEMPF